MLRLVPCYTDASMQPLECGGRNNGTGTFRRDFKRGIPTMMFKGCNRCGGNMYLEEEGRHRDLVCLQCGNRPPDSGHIIDEMKRARLEAARA